MELFTACGAEGHPDRPGTGAGIFRNKGMLGYVRVCNQCARWNMKQRIRKAGILLLGLMILFTIISRTAYNMSTAEVSTERAERQTFTPDVSARGTVTGSREIAVSTVENLRVGTVRVMEGQAVDAGEILFEVDLQDLTEKMKEKRQELEIRWQKINSRGFVCINVKRE